MHLVWRGGFQFPETLDDVEELGVVLYNDGESACISGYTYYYTPEDDDEDNLVIGLTD